MGQAGSSSFYVDSRYIQSEFEAGSDLVQLVCSSSDLVWLVFTGKATGLVVGCYEQLPHTLTSSAVTA